MSSRSLTYLSRSDSSVWSITRAINMRLVTYREYTTRPWTLAKLSQQCRNFLTVYLDKILETARQFAGSINDGKCQLEKLERSLKPGRNLFASISPHFLKWPFRRKDAERIVEDLERCKLTKRF